MIGSKLLELNQREALIMRHVDVLYVVFRDDLVIWLQSAWTYFLLPDAKLLQEINVSDSSSRQVCVVLKREEEIEVYLTLHFLFGTP